MTLELAPLTLAIILAYSYMKRVTRWSHLVLGLALGIAPSAAWIAVRGSLRSAHPVLTVAVMLWVAGFDVLYACQDFEHDRAAGLNSVPQAFGLAPAFWIARAMHLGMLCMLLWLVRSVRAGAACHGGRRHGGGAAAVRAQHRLAARPAADECGVLHAEWGDLGCCSSAFFAADVLLHK